MFNLPSEQLNPLDPLRHEQTLGPVQSPRYEQWFSNSHETNKENNELTIHLVIGSGMIISKAMQESLAELIQKEVL